MSSRSDTVWRMQLKPGGRVMSSDYGRGTVLSVGPSEVHIRWDEVYTPGSQTHLLVHDLGFAERLTELVDDGDGNESPAAP